MYLINDQLHSYQSNEDLVLVKVTIVCEMSSTVIEVRGPAKPIGAFEDIRSPAFY